MISVIILLFIAAISNRILAYPEGPGCGALLTNKIVHSTFDGSEPINSSFDESHALLNSTNAWCSRDTNTLQYLMVTLGKPANLSGFEIQGRSSSNQYLTTFRISYQATEQDSFQLFPSISNSKVFKPNVSNGDQIAYFPLDETTMKAVRFLPFAWSDRICIRMELYGCVPIDGNFTSWSEWSGCSRSCGHGTKIRYRSCSHPAPANGGKDCVGDELESTECVGVYCPVDGGFSDWSQWRPCSVTCGSGFQLRSRACNNPFPQNGGKPCQGNMTEGQACKKANCGGTKDDPTTFNAKKSTDEGGDADKYFIPMLVLVALVILFIFVLVGIVLYIRLENKRRRKATTTESNENIEKGGNENLKNGGSKVISVN